VARRRPASAALIGVSALTVLGLLRGGLWHNYRLTEAFMREQRERGRTDRVVQDALETMSRLVHVDSSALRGSQPQAFCRQLGEELGAFYQRLLSETGVQGASGVFIGASLYSLCSRAIRTNSKIRQDDRESLAEKYAAQALVALRKAAAAGLFQSSAYKEHLRKDLELAAIRARAEFQDLLLSVEERVP
jgi:hypothetical protein